MIKFAKPGKNRPFREMAAGAIRIALQDAQVSVDDIEQAFATYIYELTGSGQHAIYDVFQSGIPIVNLNNACASGSSGLYLARQLIESGALDCILVVGFDEMPRGAIDFQFPTEMAGVRVEAVLDAGGYANSEYGEILRWFGAAGRCYLDTYDATPDIFAKVSVKSRRHAQQNPYAVLTADIDEKDVLDSPIIYGDYLTKYMACPPTCGAAAAILVSREFADRNNIGKTVEIVAQSMTTDTLKSWTNAMNACGYDNTARAAREVYELSGIGPDDIDVVELHDCFTPNEVLSYESLGLCSEGGASKYIREGDNTYGGKHVVNPSGGLMSKGHPIGATGLAQCCELVWQMRGEAGSRQVDNARVALQHNIGIVGAAVVTMYRAQAT